MNARKVKRGQIEERVDEDNVEQSVKLDVAFHAFDPGDRLPAEEVLHRVSSCLKSIIT